jgi:hypothetical protein
MRSSRAGILLVCIALVGTAAVLTPPATASPTQRSGPSPRCCFGMARNPGGGLVLFGGMDSSYDFLGDTWTWDGAAWTEQHPVHSPDPREGFSLVYDAATGQVVLFGGATDLLLNDTWTWDGRDWIQQHPARWPPRAAAYGMAFDASTERVVLVLPYDSDTWTWDGTGWAKERPADKPPGRDSASQMARDGDHVVMFGGTICPELCEYFFRDTWTWDGTTWTQQFPATSPRGRYGGAFAYDQATHNTLLFGGLGHGFRDDTWEWDGSDWNPLHAPVSPSARYGVRMAYDGSRDELVLFGGIGPGQFLGDTWTWDGAIWTEH